GAGPVVMGTIGEGRTRDAGAQEASLTDTNVTPAGSVSASTTPVAGDGPPFVTTRLYVRLCPTTGWAGMCVFVTARSAIAGGACTVVCSIAALLPAFGSP